MRRSRRPRSSIVHWWSCMQRCAWLKCNRNETKSAVCIWLEPVCSYIHSRQRRDKIIIISRGDPNAFIHVWIYIRGSIIIMLVHYTRVAKWSFADIGELENRLLGWKKIIIIRAYFNYYKKLHCIVITSETIDRHSFIFCFTNFFFLIISSPFQQLWVQ